MRDVLSVFFITAGVLATIALYLGFFWLVGAIERRSQRQAGDAGDDTAQWIDVRFRRRPGKRR